MTRTGPAKRPLLAFAGALVLLSGILPVARPAPAAAVSSGLVISQVYGGGGNSGAPYSNDFVELFNRGTADVTVTNWSIQYSSTAGTSWGSQKAIFSGTVPAGRYLLVQLAAGTTASGSLPTPDATGTFNMSATSGKLALVSSSTSLPAVTCPADASIVDLIGYGSTAATSGFCFEGAGPAPATTNSTASVRAVHGCTDTDSNNTDFATAAPAPRNSATAAAPCGTVAPNLSVSDVSQNEGDAGTSASTFTVSLSAPAGPGGVTFDIATADGTATTAGGDYSAASRTGQTIPQGSSSYPFDVTVNGDTTVEPNETFLVNVTNVTSATVTDGQGQGTILNDDSATNPSGSGTASPPTVTQGGDTLLTVAVTPGTGPASTGIGVTADLTAIGGSGTQPLFDDGTGGDVTAGDGTWSYLATVSPATSPGGKSLPFTITDAQSRTGSGSISLTVTADPCTGGFTPVYAIQGSGPTSPLAGSPVTTRGIVTGDFESSAGLSGFFLQDPSGDGDTATSDGVFVFNGAANSVSAGDLVTVSGTVVEFGASDPLTEIGTVTSIATCSTGNAIPAPTPVSLPEPANGWLERLEGMRISLTQTLTVDQTFFTARFGEVSLSSGGRLMQPTNIYPAASPERAALQAENQRRLIFLDDGRSAQNPLPPPYFNASAGAPNTLRSGDTTSSAITGFLDQGPINTGATPRDYRIQPTPADRDAITFAGTNPRTASPPSVGGTLKVASFNVLNYFNTIDETGSPGCFPSGTRSDCRGADSATEFQRQRAKEIAAITAMGADIVGLMEMENDGDGPSSAIQDLVNGLNAASAPGTWDFVPDDGTTGYDTGGDAIRVKMIYRTASVTRVGPSVADKDPVHNRYPLAQLFQETAGGERLWVVVNHLKSKSSPCGTGGDADSGDGQGCWNAKRVAQASRLLIFIDTLKATDQDVLAIGDYNAYGKEDPILTLGAGGLTNEIEKHIGNADAWSFVFDSYSGYLDHALASAHLDPAVTGVSEWHIDADEPGYIDYNTEFKNPDYYQPTAYRSSDHDPVIVGLALARIGTTTAITSDEPDPSVVDQAVTVQYTVTPAITGAGTPSGDVTVSDGTVSCTATVAAGQCSITFASAGARSLTATYAGDGDFDGSTSAAQPHTVDLVGTTTAITSDQPDPSVVNESVTVQYTVTPGAAGTPSGDVTVSDGTLSCTATVAAGQCSITFTSAGSKSLTATYSGDARFSGSTSAPEPHTVARVATTTAITSDAPDPSAANQAVSVTYTVTPAAPGSGAPTGTVTVSDGTVSCTGTVAAGQCSITFTSGGAKSLVATYTGDAAFSGSASAPEPHTVNRNATTTTIISDAPDPSAAGQPVVVRYAVTAAVPGSGTPGGNVTVTDGTDSCTGTVAAGQCAISLTTVGKRLLTATYAGDAAFTGSTSAAQPHTVKKKVK